MSNKEGTVRRVYGRETTVREIDLKAARSFCDLQHRHKSAKRGTCAYGLFDKDEALVGVAVFGLPRHAAKQRKYSFELYRLAFARDVRVVGGASKIIKAFIEEKNPPDFFTFQDRSGEATDVYEKCGMNLVEKRKEQQYLVKPGVTLEGAEWGAKEVYTIAEAARRGPDALLGTNLGEVYQNGKRLTNIQLFTDVLGWSKVSTPGDWVYEWVDTSRTYYVYEITATDSDKYYFGTSHVKIPNATEEDCLNDGYYGSGGLHQKNNKFANWKKKHSERLQKKVLGVFAYRSEAYAYEGELIGDKYKTDSLCLNSVAGGWVPRPSYKDSSWSMKVCPTHGETKFHGDKCQKCLNEKMVQYKVCPTHGKTKHNGDVCRKCLNDKMYSEKRCPTHGLTIFQGDKCRACINEKIKPQVKTCTICGDEFKTKSSRQTVCFKEHEWECSICGKKYYSRFEKKSCSFGCSLTTVERRHPKRPIGSCSTHGETKVNSKGECLKCKHGYARVCAVCGEDFMAKSSRQTVCDKEHEWECFVCGKKYYSRFEKRVCGQSCAQKSRKVVSK